MLTAREDAMSIIRHAEDSSTDQSRYSPDCGDGSQTFDEDDSESQTECFLDFSVCQILQRKRQGRDPKQFCEHSQVDGLDEELNATGFAARSLDHAQWGSASPMQGTATPVSFCFDFKTTSSQPFQACPWARPCHCLFGTKTLLPF
jgi:hypothetical protein